MVRIYFSMMALGLAGAPIESESQVQVCYINPILGFTSYTGESAATRGTFFPSQR